MKKILISILFIFSLTSYSQVFDFPTTDFQNRISKSKVNKVSVWSSNTIDFSNKELISIMNFDSKGRIINEIYDSSPYYTFLYPNDSITIRLENADEYYTFIDVFYFDSKNNLIRKFHTAKECYNEEVNYDYENDVLIRERIIYNNCDMPPMYVDSIEYNYYENGKLKELINRKDKKTEMFTYDKEGNINKIIKHGENPDWSTTIIEFVYKGTKLISKKETSFYNGKKDEIQEKTWEYFYEKGLLSNIKFEDLYRKKLKYTRFEY